MTYYVGDDSTITFPVTDQADPPGVLDFTPVVTAHTSDGTTMNVPGVAWLGPITSSRDLQVPLADLPAGLWGLRLTIDGGPDLFLGNAYIQ